MEPGIERVEQDDSLARKKSRHQPPERGTKVLLGPVGILECLAHLVTRRAFERFRGCAHDLADSLAKRHFSDAPPGSVSRRILQAQQPASAGPETVVDFVEVMIFGCQPEDGHSVDAALSDLRRDADGGQRFVNAVAGSGEEAYLLPRNNGCGAGGQPIQAAGRCTVTA